jgi:hypothetical protein
VNDHFDDDVAQDINSTSFGRISQAFDPRIIQFALKFNF